MRFLTDASLPPAPYDHGELPLDGVDWAVTSEFSQIARDHCAAVCATDLALWYAAHGPACASLSRDGSKEETFRAVHALVGNGPVPAIARHVRRYSSRQGCPLCHSSIRGPSALQQAIGRGHPCALLLTAAPLDWHWVLAVGWRRYPDGTFYIRVMDGWHPRPDRFFQLRRRPWLVSATEYWPEDLDR